MSSGTFAAYYPFDTLDVIPKLAHTATRKGKAVNIKYAGFSTAARSISRPSVPRS